MKSWKLCGMSPKDWNNSTFLKFWLYSYLNLFFACFLKIYTWFCYWNYFYSLYILYELLYILNILINKMSISPLSSRQSKFVFFILHSDTLLYLKIHLFLLFFLIKQYIWEVFVTTIEWNSSLIFILFHVNETLRYLAELQSSPLNSPPIHVES